MERKHYIQRSFFVLGGAKEEMRNIRAQQESARARARKIVGYKEVEGIKSTDEITAIIIIMSREYGIKMQCAERERQRGRQRGKEKKHTTIITFKCNLLSANKNGLFYALREKKYLNMAHRRRRQNTLCIHDMRWMTKAKAGKMKTEKELKKRTKKKKNFISSKILL